MQLDDNKWITKAIAEALAADNWTISKLATANVDRLVDYPGIGQVTAQRIINESVRLMNEAQLAEANALDNPRVVTGTNKPQTAAPAESEPAEGGELEPPYAMSVRVRRIWEARQRGELI